MFYKAITGTLTALTAVHVGAGRGGDCTDAPLRVNTRGSWVLPATVIAGVLRSVATKIAPRLGHKMCKALTEEKVNEHCGCIVCALFGELRPGPDQGGVEQGKASLARFYDAAITEMPGNPLIRDMVGISRHTGAASDTAKYDVEVIPPKTKFELRIELDTAGGLGTQDMERLLAVSLSEWQQGRAYLGGYIARGMGNFILEDLAMRQYDLDNKEELIEYLKCDEPWKNGTKNSDYLPALIKSVSISRSENSKKTPYEAGTFVQVYFPLQFRGPFLLNDVSAAGLSGFDHVPQLEALQPGAKPIVSGSTLRGAIHQHAGKIARTLAYNNSLNSGSFLSSCPACDPLVREPALPLASCVALLKKIKYPQDKEIEDNKMCLSCRLFGSTRRGSRLIVSDSIFADNREPEYKLIDFLAIDRFTGGGRDGAKFDALVIWQPVFDAKIIIHNPAKWELGWLALVLRDLAEGYINIGFGSSKGFGKVKVPYFKVTLGYLDNFDLEGLVSPGCSFKAGKSGIYDSICWETRKEYEYNNLLNVTEEWVKCFVEKIEAFKREDEMELKADYDTLGYYKFLFGGEAK